jgi:rod shape determining protein RodA
LLSFVDYRIYVRYSKLVYVVTIIALILPFIFGAVTRGSQRWLQIGPAMLQPSELAKPLLILFFAALFSKESAISYRKLSLGITLISVPVLLVFKQPDLGTATVLFLSFLGILFASKVSWKIIFSLLSALVVATPLSWFLAKDYQRQRLLSFLSPLSDPLGSGYHVIQAKVAVGAGQLFGRGLGKGTQSHLRFLPEKHTDFIFASLAEELGFLGSLCVLALFGLLLQRILKIGENSRDQFGFLVCIGVFFLIFCQSFINIGINLGLLPVTGITLPLLSYGGSSLLATTICLGIVQNVAKQSLAKKVIEIK